MNKVIFSPLIQYTIIEKWTYKPYLIPMPLSHLNPVNSLTLKLQNNEATPRFAKQIVPAGKTSLRITNKHKISHFN